VCFHLKVRLFRAFGSGCDAATALGRQWQNLVHVPITTSGCYPTALLPLDWAQAFVLHVYVVRAQRFEHSSHSAKIKTSIDFPAHLDMAPYLSSTIIGKYGPKATD
jgi:hypothetical protein